MTICCVAVAPSVAAVAFPRTQAGHRDKALHAQRLGSRGALDAVALAGGVWRFDSTWTAGSVAYATPHRSPTHTHTHTHTDGPYLRRVRWALSVFTGARGNPFSISEMPTQLFGGMHSPSSSTGRGGDAHAEQAEAMLRKLLTGGLLEVIVSTPTPAPGTAAG